MPGKKARKKLNKIKHDLGMLAEAYAPSLMDSAFELTYDVPWYLALKRAIQNYTVNPLWQRYRVFNRQFPGQTAALRFIENHDQLRFIALFGEDATRAATVLLFTWEGAPLIFNGQEFGEPAPSRAPALFRPHFINWNRGRPELLRFYQELIQFRHNHPTLVSGETIRLKSDSSLVMSFLRADP